MDEEPTTERDNVAEELNEYKRLKLTADEKKKLNLLGRWKKKTT